MIIRLTTDGFELDAALDKYAHAKVERLKRYIPRCDRSKAQIEITLHETNTLTVERTCQLLVRLPYADLQVSETSQHMYASLDIAAVAMTEQLRAFRRRQSGRMRRIARHSRTQAKPSK